MVRPSTAFAGFIKQTGPSQWDESTVLDLLYIIARDNENEDLVALLSEAQPEGLFRLAEAAVGCDEPDARWQLAEYLGKVEGDRARAEAILLVLVHDGAEYVSRRALLALANLGSSHLSSLCERAWATGHEYQRIAALHAIRAASPRSCRSISSSPRPTGASMWFRMPLHWKVSLHNQRIKADYREVNRRSINRSQTMKSVVIRVLIALGIMVASGAVQTAGAEGPLPLKQGRYVLEGVRVIRVRW